MTTSARISPLCALSHDNESAGTQIAALTCISNQIEIVIRLEAPMKYLDSRLYVFAMVMACVIASATLFPRYSQGTRDAEDYAMAEPFSSAYHQMHHSW